MTKYWALVRGGSGDFTTNHLYSDEREAREDIGPGFVRILKEHPIDVPPPPRHSFAQPKRRFGGRIKSGTPSDGKSPPPAKPESGKPN